MAGPDEIQSRGYTLSLPRLGKPVSALRVARVGRRSVGPVSKAVRGRVEAVAATLRDLGATVDDSARPDLTSKARKRRSSFCCKRRCPRESPTPITRHCAVPSRTLAADDHSERANTLRAQAASFRDWTRHNEARTHMRWAWSAFFNQYDVLLCPIMPTSAFPHDHRPFGQRTIDVDGATRPVLRTGLLGRSCWRQLSAGDGRSDRTRREGLPIGIQIVGPEYGDLATIGVAQVLEQNGFAFKPPPGY